MYLTDEGLSEIEKVADKQKNVAVLYLISPQISDTEEEHLQQ